MSDILIVDELPPNFNWYNDLLGLDEIYESTKGEGVKIGIIDTGIDESHEDIKGRVKASINTYSQTKDVSDDNGHGTHVAGLLVGRNTGIAPQSDLYVAKVLNNNGYGDLNKIMTGITFAINNNVDVLCISLGVYRRLPLILEDRIKKAYEKGITIVCATGNSSKHEPEYPARYDFVIGVAGSDKNGELADFSNFGWETDILAPAVDIYSTYPNNKYACLSGTSQSAPIVAGVIALIKSYYRKQGVELSQDDIKRMFNKIVDRKTKKYSNGIINAKKMLD